MLSNTLLTVAAAISGAEAVARGFNYGSTYTDGSALTQSEYEALFARAKTLQGTAAFTSARLYTNIQGGTTNTYSEAFAAAIAEDTDLLLGIWCSAGDSDVEDEITALTSAISALGTSFTDRVTAISVGSEDLYRDSVTGIENDDGVGAGPELIVSYISQVKSALSGTALASVPIGHVDTWDAWTNTSNSAVIDAVDWIGVDSYPYFETTVANGIADAKSDFFTSIDAVKAVAGSAEVWITETGWPVSGPTESDAVASVANAETYWQEVACEILGTYNVYWYTLTDSLPTTPSPSFGIIGSDLSSDPLYSLACNASSSSSSSSASSSKTSTASSKTSAASSKTSGTGVVAASTTGSASAYSTSYSTGVVTITSGSSTMVLTTSVPVGYNGTSIASATGTAASTSVASASGSSATGSAAASSSSPISTNAAASTGSAVGAGILAIFGLVAVL